MSGVHIAYLSLGVRSENPVYSYVACSGWQGKEHGQMLASDLRWVKGQVVGCLCPSLTHIC